MSQGKTIIGLQGLFILEKNNKSRTRGHSLKLTKVRCTRDCWKHFFFNRVDQQIVGATSLNAFIHVAFGRTISVGTYLICAACMLILPFEPSHFLENFDRFTVKHAL